LRSSKWCAAELPNHDWTLQKAAIPQLQGYFASVT